MGCSISAVFSEFKLQSEEITSTTWWHKMSKSNPWHDLDLSCMKKNGNKVESFPNCVERPADDNNVGEADEQVV